MSQEISINESFNGVITALDRSVDKIDNGVSKEEYFEYTNLKPYEHDLELLIKLVECLEKYKTLFVQDINKLEEIGLSIRKQDEELANSVCTLDEL